VRHLENGGSVYLLKKIDGIHTDTHQSRIL